MYYSLQTCRAVAALMVVLHHLGALFALEKYFDTRIFESLFVSGDAGVEFFFVLSGFIIVHAHKRDFGHPDRLLIYIYKRAVRIYPSYLIVFFVVCALALISGQLPPTFPGDLPTFIKSVLLLPQDKAVVGGTGAPVVGVAWTLQYEILFYSLFALGILDKRLGVLIITLYLLLFGLSQFGIQLQFPLSFVGSEYILVFLMGMLVHPLSTVLSRTAIPPLSIFIFGLIFALTVSVWRTITVEYDPGLTTLLYGLGFSAIVLGLINYEATQGKVLSHPLLQLLGGASYVLYLTHMTVISILCKVCVQLGLHQAGTLITLTLFLFIGLIAVVISLVFYQFVERPMARQLISIYGSKGRMKHSN